MLSVQNVSKRFVLYGHPIERVIESLRPGPPQGKEFWAIKDVSLHVEPGEVVAIVGPNGSGKSTLLQIVSGILRPTAGRVLCSGRMAALLELGAGFNPEFSGRENVYLNGEIMGLSRREMDLAFPAIEAFAGIGKFIDRPVKEYSSGMYVRLAFSTAIHVNPDLLIVDEALSVGDAIFASRCIRKFEELRQRKVTVLLVSHDLGLVKRLADRAVFLLNGRVVMEGTPKDAVNRYVGYILEREGRNGDSGPADALSAASTFRHGDGSSRITDVQLLNGSGNSAAAFCPGETMVIRVIAEFLRPVEDPVVGVLIRNRIGVDVFGTNTRIERIELGRFEAGEKLHVEFDLDCLLTRHEYTLTVATQYSSGLSQDWLDDVLSFRVIDSREIAGILNLNPRIRHKKISHS